MQSQAADSLNPPAVSATFANGVVDSLPIVIGYVPVAFAFGLSAVKLGFSPLESIFFSCIIYAGASQFVITALLSAGMSLWVSALTVMAMDVRHLLYGPALRHRIVSRMSPGKTAMWAFGLTDEVFAAATARLMRNNRSWSENWMLGIALCAWLSWVAGTALGALYAADLWQPPRSYRDDPLYFVEASKRSPEVSVLLLQLSHPLKHSFHHDRSLRRTGNHIFPDINCAESLNAFQYF